MCTATLKIFKRPSPPQWPHVPKPPRDAYMSGRIPPYYIQKILSESATLMSNEFQRGNIAHEIIKIYLMAPGFWIIGAASSIIYFHIEFGLIAAFLVMLAEITPILFIADHRKSINNSKCDIKESLTTEEINDLANTASEIIFHHTRKLGVWVDLRDNQESDWLHSLIEVTVDQLESEHLVERSHFLTPLTARLTERAWQLHLMKSTPPNVNITSQAEANGKVEGTYIVNNSDSFIVSTRNVGGDISISRNMMEADSEHSNALLMVAACLRSDIRNEDIAPYNQQLASVHADEAERLAKAFDKKEMGALLENLGMLLENTAGTFESTRIALIRARRA